MMRNSLWFVGLLILSLTLSCSDDNGISSKDDFDIIPTARTVNVPSRLQGSASDYAAEAVEYISKIDDLSEVWASSFTPSTAEAVVFTKSGDTSIYKQDYAGGSATIKFWQTSTRYFWQYLIDDGSDNIYNNWLWLTAEESKDSTSGKLVVYEDKKSSAAYTWNWTYGATDSIYSVSYSITLGGANARIEAQTNPDGTGLLDYYSEDVYELAVDWEADGSGQWWTYVNDIANWNGTWGSGELTLLTPTMKAIPYPDKMAEVDTSIVTQAVSIINTMNQYKQVYELYFAPVSGAVQKVSGVALDDRSYYSWKDSDTASLLIKLYYSNNNNYNVWNVAFDGNDNQNTYNNWKFIDAEENGNNTKGNFIVYQYSATADSLINWEWEWAIDFRKDYLVTYKINSNDIVVTFEPNSSGTFRYYEGGIESSLENDIPDYKIAWEADGSGEWWTYDSEGTIEENDTWLGE